MKNAELTPDAVIVDAADPALTNLLEALAVGELKPEWRLRLVFGRKSGVTLSELVTLWQQRHAVGIAVRQTILGLSLGALGPPLAAADWERPDHKPWLVAVRHRERRHTSMWREMLAANYPRRDFAERVNLVEVSDRDAWPQIPACCRVAVILSDEVVEGVPSQYSSASVVTLTSDLRHSNERSMLTRRGFAARVWRTAIYDDLADVAQVLASRTPVDLQANAWMRAADMALRGRCSPEWTQSAWRAAANACVPFLKQWSGPSAASATA